MHLRILSCIAVLTAFLLAGCESSIKERTVDAPPKVQEFDGSIDRVYAAAQRAFRRLDFVLVRSSIGRIEAASAVHHSTAFDNARQVTAQVRIRDTSPGKCEIEMWLNEEVAGDQFGGTYRKPLPEHEFYSVYFATLQEVLGELSAQDSLEKK